MEDVTKISSEAPARGTAEASENAHLGRYRLRREIGRGFSSVVYEALDTQRGRLVALKVLTFLQNLSAERRADLSARFAREARAISALSHPGIVAIYEIGHGEDEREFIAMEILQGESLRARLLRDGTLLPEEAVPIALQIADALHYAHARGIVHRDVKPDNIFLLPDGRAKLMDFGVAHVLSDGALTQTGTVVGSPAYMSPEQINGEQLDGRSDVFSLGITLAEMLAGHKPFDAPTIPAVMHRILHQTPQMEGIAPRALRKILDKALAKNRQARFPSAGAFAEALRRQVVPHLPVWEPTATQILSWVPLPPAYRSARAEGDGDWAPPVGPPPPKHRRAAWGLSAAAALLAGTFLWAATAIRPRPVTEFVPVISQPFSAHSGDMRSIPIAWHRAPSRRATRPPLQRSERGTGSTTPVTGVRIVEAKYPSAPALALPARPLPPAAPAAPAPPAAPAQPAPRPIAPRMAVSRASQSAVRMSSEFNKSGLASPVVKIEDFRQEQSRPPSVPVQTAVPAVPAVSDPDVEQPDLSQNDGSADMGPRLLRRAPLLYPNDVPEDSVTGTVLLRVFIDGNGSVSSATIIRSSGSTVVDQAALQTIQDYEYTPAQHNGKSVSGVVSQRITYP